MATEVQAELSTQQLADRLHVSPRMINLYREKAEVAAGRKLGIKRGRTTYFNPDEQVLIIQVQSQGINPDEVRTHHEQQQAQASQNFQSFTNQAESNILDGMGAIVEAGDQNAIQLGNALGERWNALMFGAALQRMQSGIVHMQKHLGEMHTSVSLTLDQVDPKMLNGRGTSDFLLPEGE